MFKLERVCIKCGGEVEGWTDEKEIVVRRKPELDYLHGDDLVRVKASPETTIVLGRVHWKPHVDDRTRHLWQQVWCKE